MSLNDVINVSITERSSALSLPGFGTPMILPPVHTHFAERLRYYTDPADMIADGFLATDPAYIEAQAIMSQRPRPQRFAVGRRATPAAEVVDLVFNVVANNHHYLVTIFDGSASYTFDYLSDGTATVAEIRDGLLALINASPVNVTASANGNNTRLTADVAGIPFVVSGLDADTAQVSVTPNTGITEDLIAINDFQPDWYGLLLTQRDLPHILVAAAAIETQRRIFIAQSSDVTIINAPYNSVTPAVEAASQVRALGYARTAVFYHPTDAQSLVGGLMGIGLAQIPASITWKFKEVVGATPTRLTATQRTNLLSKNANGYEPLAGRSMTFEGTVGDGEYLDVIHGIDKLYSKIQELVFGSLISTPKIPFTAPGISTVASSVYAALKESERDGLIATSRTLANGTVQVPAFTVTPPAIQDISPTDRAARRIPAGNPIRFEGTLAGAVHAVTVTGTLSV